MAKEKSDRDELERKEPAVLPAREAMTIIAPSASGGFMPDLSSMPDAGAAHQAGTDAQASASAEESVTDEDRDDHFESHDSASSQT